MLSVLYNPNSNSTSFEMDASSCGHEPTIQSISANVVELTTSIYQQCTILSQLHTTVDKNPTSGAVKAMIESLEPTVTNTHNSLIAVTTDLSTTLTSVQNKHRYDARLGSTKSDHQAQINDLKAGFEAQLKELRDINVKHEASLAVKTSEHKNALTDLRRTQDRLNTVSESVTELIEELSATVERYDEAFESTRCSQRKALDASDQRRLKELEAKNTEHQEEVSLLLQSACSDLEGELQSTKDCARQRLRTVSYIHGQDRDLALQKQQSNHEAALSSRDASYQCSLLNLKRTHSEAFQSQEATYHIEVHDLKISHQKALDSQSRDHQKALDAKDAEYTTALALQDSGHQSAMTLPQNPLDESERQTSSKEHELSLEAQDIIAIQNDVKQLRASHAQETVTAQRGEKQQLVEAQAVQIRDLKQQLETSDGKVQKLSAQFDQFREQILKMQTAQPQRLASQQSTERQSELPPSPSAGDSRMPRQRSFDGPDDQHVLPEANVPGQPKVIPHMNKSGHSTGRAEERATTQDTVQGSPTSEGSPAVTNRSDRTMSPAAKRTLAIAKAQQLRAMIYLAWDVTTAEEAEFMQSLNSLFSHGKIVDKVADGIDLYCRRTAKMSSGPCFRSSVVCVAAGKGGPTMTAANCPSCKKGKKTCFFARFAPGLDENSDSLETVQLESHSDVRWILKKRRANQHEPEEVAWEVGGVFV